MNGDGSDIPALESREPPKPRGGRGAKGHQYRPRHRRAGRQAQEDPQAAAGDHAATEPTEGVAEGTEGSAEAAGGEASTPDPRRRRRRGVRIATLSALVAFVALLAVGLLTALHVDRSASAGEQALLAAEADLQTQRLASTKDDLAAATLDFRRVQREMAAVQPLIDVARAIPVLDVQVHAVQVLATAGLNVSRAGTQAVTALSQTERLSGGGRPFSNALGELRRLQSTLADVDRSLDAASSELATLNGYRLFGPIGKARSVLKTRLAKVANTAHSAADGLNALTTFLGGSGPRQYLVLSQNPDEIRPTGGFFGSYGLLTADSAQLRLALYDDITNWYVDHPDNLVPAAQLGSPFRLLNPPMTENLANVNTVPDWPQVAQLALELWRNAGQQADGVISFTPEFMARILSVLGPVQVPSFNVTVTSGNVVQELNYFTHVAPPSPDNPKAFLPPLGQAVMAKLLAAPSSQWADLAIEVGRSFTTGDLLLWSRDDAVESALQRRGWSGALPAAPGDFFDGAEFDYAAKNGGGIKRTYDHVVTLRPDGSAEITTTVTLDNTEPAGILNDTPLLYVTVYAPAGAKLTVGSDSPAAIEPSIAGHPAAGYFVGVTPETTTTLTLSWDAPGIAAHLSNGEWQYRLDWQNVVDNPGDVLDLTVVLPPKAHWTGQTPPKRTLLAQNLTGAWTYRL